MFLFRKKKPNTERIILNIIKYSNGNTRALNKYELTNLLYALTAVHGGPISGYVKNNNGTWVSYGSGTKLTKNMLLKNISYWKSSNYRNYLTRYRKNPNMFSGALKRKFG